MIFSLSKKFGRKIGVYSKKTYLPEPIDGEQFSHIPGQTTKLVGMSTQLFAYDPNAIQAKAVIAMNNTLTETFVATAIANPFETD